MITKKDLEKILEQEITEKQYASFLFQTGKDKVYLVNRQEYTFSAEEDGSYTVEGKNGTFNTESIKEALAYILSDSESELAHESNLCVCYQINDAEYEMYRASSGDFCVTVNEYGKESLSYNLDSEQDALDFILSGSEVYSQELVNGEREVFQNAGLFTSIGHKMDQSVNLAKESVRGIQDGIHQRAKDLRELRAEKKGKLEEIKSIKAEIGQLKEKEKELDRTISDLAKKRDDIYASATNKKDLKQVDSINEQIKSNVILKLETSGKIGQKQEELTERRESMWVNAKTRVDLSAVSAKDFIYESTNRAYTAARKGLLSMAEAGTKAMDNILEHTRDAISKVKTQGNTAYTLLAAKVNEISRAYESFCYSTNRNVSEMLKSDADKMEEKYLHRAEVRSAGKQFLNAVLNRKELVDTGLTPWEVAKIKDVRELAAGFHASAIEHAEKFIESYDIANKTLEDAYLERESKDMKDSPALDRAYADIDDTMQSDEYKHLVDCVTNGALDEAAEQYMTLGDDARTEMSRDGGELEK